MSLCGVLDLGSCVCVFVVCWIPLSTLFALHLCYPPHILQFLLIAVFTLHTFSSISSFASPAGLMGR